MSLLSSIFPQYSLSYKMPLRFNNLDIGEGFPLLQNAPSFSTTVSYKDIPFATKCHPIFSMTAHAIRNQFKNTHKGKQELSNESCKRKEARTANSMFSLQNASVVFSKLRFGPYLFATKCPFDFYKPVWSSSCHATKCPFDFYKPVWSSSCHATKCHFDFHDGLTWLKWLLYKMRFLSLSYKIMDLENIPELAWLKRKLLYSAQTRPSTL